MDALYDLLRPDQVSTSPSERALHARGESYDEGVLPDAVVFPESTEDVARVLRYAHQRGVPVTPVAVNSSLEGHTVPLHGGLSLDLTRMNRVLEYRPQDLLAVVQPGVTYPQLNERARRDGLFFPVDPGAHASLGGMISTNASGTAAVRYGVTADFVLALEVVLPTGEVIRTGSRARKSASGYNLTKLFCGAEGTLGVITEATVRLVGLPEAAAAARVPFADVEAATRFVTALIQAGVPVARCELVDPLSIAAVNAHSGTRYPEEMTVFLEFHGNPAGIAEEVALARELAEHHGALAFEASHDAAARAELWHARHGAFYAIVAQNPGKRSLITDLAVPISALPEAVTRSLAACREAGFSAYLIGHVGDGNFHLTIFYDAGDAGQAQRVAALGHALVALALSLGGTSTGEHGVGLRKLRYMAREHGAALDVMRTLKRALDPHNIMNPGKKVPLGEIET
ncbi:FAD-binding oxidoreductase [Truepera radiovictrix]|uniref:D-lactate dehydrogenase (cytochrome) n=1 Tax=Truepera radiovictrix (strain DSM 17093 / CIP 108686 / LMG 22925 / RQ-24) TaxID=649638 RepID=D7CWL8_TRURR|nr:FAD-linked oxidase C-terminal domain-containing protein [Truepera radiovictrix]ADI14417.1 FAD linked oxidase domain protein [Truepera radiovictrix DSM 17093]WMT57026.1 FAD-linked oxidase C-terminal domain-containing protein [Truepera radiovictrix]